MRFPNITSNVMICLHERRFQKGLAMINADVHIKRQMMGREVVAAVMKNLLDICPWKQTFYGVFDRHRETY